MSKLMRSFTIAALVVATLLIATMAMAQESFDLARRAYQQKDWNSVVRHGKMVVEEFPEWFWGHYLLGKGYFNLGQYDSAISSLRKSVDFAENPDDGFRGKFAVAEAYYRKRDYKNTLRWIASAKRNSSSKYYAKSANIIAGMEGYSHFNLRDWNDAVKAFKPMVDAGNASADILRAVAISYQNLNQDSNAISVITQVVRKDAKDIDAHRILVKSYLNKKDWRNAITAANTALGHFDRDWELHYFKGRAHQELKQYKSAESSLRSSIAISAQDKVRKLLGDTLVAQGKYREAAEEYTKAQRTYASDPVFFFNMAYAWYSFVPKDAQNYKDTPQEGAYNQALKNAEDILAHVKTMNGSDKNRVANLLEVIGNKKERLKLGATYVEEFEVSIDPETGEIIEKKIK